MGRRATSGAGLMRLTVIRRRRIVRVMRRTMMRKVQNRGRSRMKTGRKERKDNSNKARMMSWMMLISQVRRRS